MNPIEVDKFNSYFFSFIAGGFLINFFPNKSEILDVWSGFVIKKDNSYRIPRSKLQYTKANDLSNDSLIKEYFNAPEIKDLTKIQHFFDKSIGVTDYTKD